MVHRQDLCPTKPVQVHDYKYQQQFPVACWLIGQCLQTRGLRFLIYTFKPMGEWGKTRCHLVLVP